MRELRLSEIIGLLNSQQVSCRVLNGACVIHAPPIRHAIHGNIVLIHFRSHGRDACPLWAVGGPLLYLDVAPVQAGREWVPEFREGGRDSR